MVRLLPKQRHLPKTQQCYFSAEAPEHTECQNPTEVGAERLAACEALSDEVASGIARGTGYVDYWPDQDVFRLMDPYNNASNSPLALSVPKTYITSAEQAQAAVVAYRELFNNDQLDIDEGEILYLADPDGDEEAVVLSPEDLYTMLGLEAPAPIAVVPPVGPGPLAANDPTPLRQAATGLTYDPTPTSDMDTGTPLEANAGDLLPPTTASEAAAPETTTLSSPNLDPTTLLHLESVFSTSTNDRANASIQGGTLFLASSALTEIDATLSMVLPELDENQRESFVRAANLFIQQELTNAKIDQNGDGISTTDFQNWQSRFETQLDTFRQEPTSIAAYIEQQSPTDRAIENPETTFESVYSANTIAALEASFSTEELAELKITALNRGLSEAHLIGLATLVGQIDAAHERISQAISSYAETDGRGSANYETITLRRLESLRGDLLRGDTLDEAQTFLDSPDFEHLLRRIEGSQVVINALSDEVELNETETRQRDNLRTFLDSVETGGGMFFTSRDLMPQITATRQALQAGDLAAAKLAITPIIDTVVGGMFSANASLRDRFFDVYHLNFRDARTLDGTVITADMVADNPEALIQAMRAADDYDGAVQTSADTALEAGSEAPINSEAMRTHILNYIDANLGAATTQAEASLDASLAQLQASSLVEYNLEMQRIEQFGRQPVVEAIATASLTIQGFRDYATLHPEANNLTQIFDDMTGGGDDWTSYIDFNLSDATSDMVNGAIVETIVTGGLAGLARSAARRLPRLAGRLSPLTSRLMPRPAQAAIPDMPAPAVMRSLDDIPLYRSASELRDLQGVAIRGGNEDLRAFIRQTPPQGLNPDNAAALAARLSEESLDGIRAAALRSPQAFSRAMDDVLEQSIRDMDAAAQLVARPAQPARPQVPDQPISPAAIQEDAGILGAPNPEVVGIEDLTTAARHGTPDEFRDILMRTVPDRPSLNLTNETLGELQTVARQNPARLEVALNEALTSVPNEVSAIAPAQANRLFSRVPGLTAASRRELSTTLARATRAGQTRMANMWDDFLAVRARLSPLQRGMVDSTLATAGVAIAAPAIADTVAATFPGSAYAEGRDPAVNTTSPAALAPGLNPARLPNVDTTPAIAPTVAAPEPDAAPAVVEAPPTLAEQMEAITSSEIRSHATEIRAILANHTSYTPGDWQQISDEIGQIYGLELATEADRVAFGNQLQAQIRETLGIADSQEALNDGKIGRETMQYLDRAMTSVSVSEIEARAADLQSFAAQSNWRDNNRGLAQLFGINFPDDATDTQLKVFGRSIQAFAGGNDGAIGTRTMARLNERLAARTNA